MLIRHEHRHATRFHIVTGAVTALCLALAGPAYGAGVGDASQLTIDHYFRLGQVSDPQISPEGSWIAYTVTREDLEEDESRSRVWMTPTDGGEAIPLTAAAESSQRPRWSPDGRYLAFLSARNEGETQVWTLRRQGGEAEQLTDTPQSVSAFEWSPDGTRLALVLQDLKPEHQAALNAGETFDEDRTGPWVIDRAWFKQDYVGYLDRRRTHIYVFDVATGGLSPLTGGDYDDDSPAWSPDGSKIAFVSNRTEDADLNYNKDIWVVSSLPAEEGLPPLTRVTDNPGSDESPAWSPDGKLITHTSITRPETELYSTAHLAVSNAAGGGLRVLTEQLDRMIFAPRFSPDGRHLLFLLEDSGEQNLARIELRSGSLKRLVGGRDVVRGFSVSPQGAVAMTIARPQAPVEVFLLGTGQLAQRSFTNREWLAPLQLGDVVDVQFSSRDGTEIEAFITRPPGFVAGRKYPTLLDIHGGPQSQDDWGFSFDHQLWAANGYLVISPNYRGSTGYGREFCLGIWQDWGGPDFEDVMAAVDHAIGLGWADPDRLGVLGWSYGGMLTNHVITKTDRFKAAATGASATLYAVNYGHDQYVRWWEQELGFPWEPEARAIYERMSPFNFVQNVTTPTLVLGGEKDWNVPIINSEQLYLALKRLGVETELVVYPGEFHGIDKPSHAQDLYQRYLDWFARHLNP